MASATRIQLVRVIETMTMRLKKDPTPPEQIRQDCPEIVSDAILRAMARDPKKRFQCANDFADAIRSG